MNQSRQRILGFTLIEVLVVILIMTVILGLALTVYNSSRKNARDQRRLRDLTTIKQALELYRNNKHDYPVSLADLVTLKYLAVLPTDPLGGSRVYQYQNPTVSTFILCAKKEGSDDFPINCGSSGLYCNSPNIPCDMGLSSD